MKFEKVRYVVLFMAFGLFLLLDRYLKWQATHGWSHDRLLNPYFGWMPFLNPGVAFSIPIPSGVVIVVTVPILLAVVYLLNKHLMRSDQLPMAKFLSVASLTGVLFGAVSNLVDRVWLKHTIDYLLIGTGVINMADVLIVVGFVVYFLSLKDKRVKLEE